MVFFQIINHDVPQELCQNMLTAVTDLFHLAPEDKALLFSDDQAKDVRICHHYRKDQASQEKIALCGVRFLSIHGIPLMILPTLYQGTLLNIGVFSTLFLARVNKENFVLLRLRM